MLRAKTAVGISAVAVIVVVALALFVASGDEEQNVRPRVIDERAGTLDGVRFGDTAAQVSARLGEESDDGEGFFPEDAHYTGPFAIGLPKSDQRPPRQPAAMHYEDTAYLASPTVGVYAMATLREGSHSKADVAVGDELRRVREVYGRVACSESVAGEPIFGGETPIYPWCRTTVGDIRVHFGGDPIASITLTRLG